MVGVFFYLRDPLLLAAVLSACSSCFAPDGQTVRAIGLAHPVFLCIRTYIYIGMCGNVPEAAIDLALAGARRRQISLKQNVSCGALDRAIVDRRAAERRANISVRCGLNRNTIYLIYIYHT